MSSVAASSVSANGVDYWIVEVRDPRDPETGAPGYVKRFEFMGEEAAPEAWNCWASALRHGFIAKVEQVRDMKGERAEPTPAT